jgi:hypothetical protein
MNTQDRTYIRPVDIHAALARAHAARAEYIRLALAGVPALLKRMATRHRPDRQRPAQDRRLGMTLRA